MEGSELAMAETKRAGQKAKRARVSRKFIQNFVWGHKRDVSKTKDSKSKPMNLSDDVVPYVFPFVHQIVKKYGMRLLPTSLFLQEREREREREQVS